MVFQALWESAEAGELLLVDGGICRWHLRRDGQLTIHEILTTVRGQGIATRMLESLKTVPGATCIVAVCPAAYASNRWYERRGFTLVATETRGQRQIVLNRWRLDLGDGA